MHSTPLYADATFYSSLPLLMSTGLSSAYGALKQCSKSSFSLGPGSLDPTDLAEKQCDHRVYTSSQLTQNCLLSLHWF